MSYFKILLEEFVNRELTFQADSLDAISGILTALIASFPAGFLFGLPEVFFDISLLWQAGGALHDRLSRTEDEHVYLPRIPSWSWAWWKGPLEFQAWEAAEEYLFLSHYQP
ncbi:hypothetical protein HBH98_069290 [Parastagonospora nodorum]|nr:hypothetical protein HBH53_056440 [Parastagonospora nodorum]KAH3982894.1 hypothetical protein HBH52_066270 [Parastagonospora nodorum]KAH4024324.1 hypothetical protein HBI09_159130 [Parastagonospora nodorum]KAH4045451.1 hypothetical protein HBH49_197730 [Parastagonospora nodorum]KAH4182763.1 hypothetical protein HBH42_213530 [Parastagonospora nodorum]